MFFEDAVTKRALPAPLKTHKPRHRPMSATSTASPPFEINFPKSELKGINFVIHAGDNENSSFQFLEWIDQAKSTGIDYAILIRNRKLYEIAAKETPEVNLIYANSASSIENITDAMPALKVVLYVSNTGNNIHLLRLNHLHHAFIGHGDSEKSASCHKFFRVYDDIWVAGQAHIDRFRNAEFSSDHIRFTKIGRYIPNSRHNTYCICGEMPLTRATDRFLYLPTWEGAFDDSSYSSLPYCESILATTRDITGTTPIVKFHPMTGHRKKAFVNIEKLIEKSPNQINTTVLKRRSSFKKYFEEVDFLVCDISSVITDFLETGKPIFVFDGQFSKQKSATSNFGIDDFCYKFHDTESLKLHLNEVFNRKNDYLKDRRHQARSYYIDADATTNNNFKMRLIELCHQQATNTQIQ